MARYTGPNNKRARRVNFSILESGKDIAKRPYGPGQHGKDRKRKPSNYSLQLQEKQKVKFIYGLTEKQFKRTFDDAGKLKGVHGEDLLKLLESRLDNLVYRIGFASTRRGARQLVNHGHVLVNGKKVDIPSFQVKPGMTIELKDNMKNNSAVLDSLEATLSTPAFVTFDKNTMKGEFVRLPERNELNPDFNELLVVEYYNRKK